MQADLSPIEVGVIAVAVIGSAWLVLSLVPSVEDSRPRWRAFSLGEITEHDRSLPKYLLGSALFLVLAGGYMLLTSIPPVHDWLASAGQDWLTLRAIALSQLLQASAFIACMGACWYWVPRACGRPLIARWMATLAFWLVALGSVVFFVGLSVLCIWTAALSQSTGAGYMAARDVLGPWITLPPLALPATATILGYVFLAANVLLTMRSREGSARSVSVAGYRGLLVAGCLALLASGVLYVEMSLGNLPSLEVHHWLAPASVCGAVFAVALLSRADVPLASRATPLRARARVVSGSLAASGLLAAAAAAPPLAPTLPVSWVVSAELLSALVFLWAVAPLARGAWGATGDYRSASWRNFRAALARYDAPRGPIRRRISPAMAIAVEAVGALAGFPGFGWLLNGRGLIGLTLALVGPAMASAVVPTLASPYGEGPLARYGLSAVFAYLVVTATLSASALAISILRESRRPAGVKRVGEGG